MAGKNAKIESFKAELQTKINNLLKEFSEGKINREQFHVVYTRYNDQLAVANRAALAGAPDAIDIAQTGPPTVVIKEEYMGKAIGMMIYHNKTGRFVETLGEFDIATTVLAPTLNDFSEMMERRKLIDRKVMKVSEKRWLLFAAGKFTTVVTLFYNEPSPFQSRELERLHHDFEEANRTRLEKGNLDSNKLAYPFLAFVQNRLKSGG
ncbi:MAG: hypothetical protein D6737_04280 [Chloroflexi bacterium]|nr:MAG: hypothetical protein D6737_04280 [Chloroflexota bacterium]